MITRTYQVYEMKSRIAVGDELFDKDIGKVVKVKSITDTPSGNIIYGEVLESTRLNDPLQPTFGSIKHEHRDHRNKH
jgi:hypothetical protein